MLNTFKSVFAVMGWGFSIAGVMMIKNGDYYEASVILAISFAWMVLVWIVLELRSLN